MDDLPFGPPLTPANPAAPRHRSHQWATVDGVTACGCGIVQDPAASRRGRNNRNRGNAIEREVGHRLGLKRVGQFGGATDLGESHDPFAVSVKSGGGYFSERAWDELKRQPVAAGQTALLVVTDSHQGRKRRAMVILDMDSWIALHGLSGVADVP